MAMQELVSEINELRRRRKAVILAHTYQNPEIQDIADVVGDSYGLSLMATKLPDAEVIVFCGVRFMAETAAILNPERTVVMPDASAGCAMAEMITADQLRAFKAQHPGAPVVCYVNSTAEVKAESDICCTSANAVRVVKSLGDVPEILFVPDQYLGHYVEGQLGRKLICWNGGCPVHYALRPEQIAKMKAAYPDYKVMVHPETTPETQALADYVLSTGGMIELVKKSSNRKWLVGTEVGILHALKKEAPDMEFVHIWPELICHSMKQTTLENLKHSLETLETRITVPEHIAKPAAKAIMAMLAVK
ncbi:MAG: quinolinate synthase NadA [Victivallales bacterium]|nr:quinolinate synthase NadA [Victivallales bacterium]